MSSYLLKITLRGTPRLVWRRFVVPSFTTLDRLHQIIQDVMGWQREHSHSFLFRKQEYVPSVRDSRAKVAPSSNKAALPEEMFSLDDLVFQSGMRLKYHYDPEGDKWIHDLAIESIRYLDDRWPFPTCCLEGVRACPPESCGGAAGFVEMLQALKDTGHPRHDEFVSRFGSFDPDRFSVEKVNRIFKVKGPVETRECISIPLPVKERTPKKESVDPLHLLGRKLKKKSAS